MPHRMKSYATFDLWKSDQRLRHQKSILALRKLVKKAVPRLTESVKWGNGCWIGKEWPVLFLHAEADHLQFGFFGGTDLKDPEQRLIGKGKYIRHVKVRTPADIDASQLTRWIKQAAKNERSG